MKDLKISEIKSSRRVGKAANVKSKFPPDYSTVSRNKIITNRNVSSFEPISRKQRSQQQSDWQQAEALQLQLQHVLWQQATEAAEVEGGAASGLLLREVSFNLNDGATSSILQVYVPRTLKALPTDKKSLYYDEKSGQAATHHYSRSIGPPAVALAQSILENPELVKGKAIIELGCGLGVPSCAAAYAGAVEIFCTDYDGEVANVALGSAFLNVVMPSVSPGISSSSRQPTSAAKGGQSRADGTIVKSASLDWLKSTEGWPQGQYDVALAADVLYDQRFPSAVAETLAKILRPSGDSAGGQHQATAPSRALITDPVDRPWRRQFLEACERNGLRCSHQSIVPGSSGKIVMMEIMWKDAVQPHEAADHHQMP